MASSLFGGVAAAISPPKLKRVTYSGDLDTQLADLTKAQTAGRQASQADLDRLIGASRTAAGQVEQLAPGDMAVLQSVINQRTDPFQTYTGVGNYNMGLLERLSGNLAEQGRAGESRRFAALGYGGRGPSTYQSNTLLDRVSKNLAPVYASTLGNIGRDASSIESNRLNQNANVVSLLRERAGIPTRSLPLYSLPLDARQQLTQDDIANLLGLGEGFKENTAGFREQQSALGNIASSLDSAVDTGLSLYSGGLMGGGGGGLGGIFGGGGGGGATRAPATFTPSNFGPSGYGNFGVSYSGGPLQAGANFGPSGYGNYGINYGAWTPQVRG